MMLFQKSSHNDKNECDRHDVEFIFYVNTYFVASVLFVYSAEQPSPCPPSVWRIPGENEGHTGAEIWAASHYSTRKVCLSLHTHCNWMYFYLTLSLPQADITCQNCDSLPHDFDSLDSRPMIWIWLHPGLSLTGFKRIQAKLTTFSHGFFLLCGSDTVDIPCTRSTPFSKCSVL